MCIVSPSIVRLLSKHERAVVVLMKDIQKNEYTEAFGLMQNGLQILKQLGLVTKKMEISVPFEVTTVLKRETVRGHRVTLSTSTWE